MFTTGNAGIADRACVWLSAVPMSATMATPPTPCAVRVGWGAVCTKRGRTSFTTGDGDVTGAGCTTTGACGADGVTSGGACSAGGDSTRRSDFSAENHRRPAPASEAEAATTASSGNGRGRMQGILPEPEDGASPGRRCSRPGTGLRRLLRRLRF